VAIAEVSTDTALVRRLLAGQFPSWAQLPIEPIASTGTDNAVYRLGKNLAVRLPRISSAANHPEKEERWLPRLASILPLAIPVPLATGRPAEGYPWHWSVVTWLPGETATRRRIADLRRAAVDLAAFVSALRRADPAGGPLPGADTSYRGGPLPCRDRDTRASIAAVKNAFDADTLAGIWETALAATPWQAAPVWLHGDLDARNLIVREGRLSGVIDFGCLGVGDPAYDVAVAWKVLSAETRNIFRSELAVDEATWTRSRGLALSQAVGALAYYTLETNPALVVEARRWMDEVRTRD
jgi:aminoglycoside phosphotransferase (APT) family kinase protein